MSVDYNKADYYQLGNDQSDPHTGVFAFRNQCNDLFKTSLVARETGSKCDQEKGVKLFWTCCSPLCVIV